MPAVETARAARRAGSCRTVTAILTELVDAFCRPAIWRLQRDRGSWLKILALLVPSLAQRHARERV
jgi:hypothetical protein